MHVYGVKIIYDGIMFAAGNVCRLTKKGLEVLMKWKNVGITVIVVSGIAYVLYETGKDNLEVEREDTDE